MEFEPVMASEPELMDPRIFDPDPMGLAEDLLHLPFEQRFRLVPEEDLFFLNLEGLSVDSAADVEAIRDQIVARLGRLGRKVHAVVNYDRFRIAPPVRDLYADMLKDLTDRFYLRETQYATSAFLHMMLRRLPETNIPDGAAFSIAFKERQQAHSRTM